MLKRTEYSDSDIHSSFLGIREYLNGVESIHSELLMRYVKAVGDANVLTNLTGSKNAASFIYEHVLDCSLAWATWKNSYPAAAGLEPVWDIGSGAGLPGVVIGCLDVNRNILCVERRATKALALKEIIKATGLTEKVKVLVQPFEEVSCQTNKATVWFRAFLPGQKLARYFHESLDPYKVGKVILMKGPAWDREEKEAQDFLNQNQSSWLNRFRNAERFFYRLPAYEKNEVSERSIVVI